MEILDTDARCCSGPSLVESFLLMLSVLTIGQMIESVVSRASGGQYQGSEAAVRCG